MRRQAAGRLGGVGGDEGRSCWFTWPKSWANDLESRVRGWHGALGCGFRVKLNKATEFGI